MTHSNFLINDNSLLLRASHRERELKGNPNHNSNPNPNPNPNPQPQPQPGLTATAPTGSSPTGVVWFASEGGAAEERGDLI